MPSGVIAGRCTYLSTNGNPGAMPTCTTVGRGRRRAWGVQVYTNDWRLPGPRDRAGILAVVSCVVRGLGRRAPCLRHEAMRSADLVPRILGSSHPRHVAVGCMHACDLITRHAVTFVRLSWRSHSDRLSWYRPERAILPAGLNMPVG